MKRILYFTNSRAILRLGPRIIYFSVLLLFLSSCFWNSKSKPEVVEVPDPVARAVDTPEEALFREGKYYYSTGLYSEARDKFDSLRYGYPLSPYLEFAEIKAADSQFAISEYEAAAERYLEFIKNHPLSPAVPYAMLQAGRSFEMLNRGVGRDPQPLEKARKQYSELLKEHPNSIYSSVAKKYLLRVNKKIAEHNRLVMQFYKKRGKHNAFEHRQKIFKSQYAHYLNNGNASLKESNLTPEKTLVYDEKEAPKILAALRISNPNHAGRASSNINGQPGYPSGLLKLRCLKKEKRAIYLQLANNPDPVFLKKHREIPSVDGQIKITLPLRHLKAIQKDCFAKKDLAISSDGMLALKSHRSARLVSLDNPPRLLIVLN
ncbi:MAG: outer membrane protein assembly factor BamD [Candidatus Dadabacteria bacterium]|nr:MAG: outer membrane protein assembly factor BamD [Candidatus Dadabacteria bacterium]